MSSVEFNWKFNKQGLTDTVKQAVNNQGFLTDIAEAYLEMVRPFVPMKTGTLRDSAKIDKIDVPDARFYVSWDTDGMPGGADYPDFINASGGYAHYIYEGEVYGPNKYKYGKFSSPVSPKTPEGRNMTYHTEGTMSHWNTQFKQGGLRYKDYRQVCKDILKGYVK